MIFDCSEGIHSCQELSINLDTLLDEKAISWDTHTGYFVLFCFLCRVFFFFFFYWGCLSVVLRTLLHINNLCDSMIQSNNPFNTHNIACHYESTMTSNNNPQCFGCKLGIISQIAWGTPASIHLCVSVSNRTVKVCLDWSKCSHRDGYTMNEKYV